MTDSAFPRPRQMHRITCVVRDTLELRIQQRLSDLHQADIVMENARCVRQRIRTHPWGLPGASIKLNDTPMVMYRLSVAENASRPIADSLIACAELGTPGNGMLYIQSTVEYAERDPWPPHLPANGSDTAPGMLGDMALLTCILSTEGSGEALASVALRLGAGLPVISRGTGTGIRDRLGLLRITISPEKELVHLLVPAQDAPGLRQLLIEGGRLDRAGGGFLYQTPVTQALTDPLLRIGRQDHAASIEQLIAAIDDLKNGTSWRKRFDADRFRTNAAQASQNPAVPYKEICFDVPEGCAGPLVEAAMNAGAGGATTAQTRCFRPSESGDSGARESGLLCVPSALATTVSDALLRAASRHAAGHGWRIQILDAPAAFSHQKRQDKGRRTS